MGDHSRNATMPDDNTRVAPLPAVATASAGMAHTHVEEQKKAASRDEQDRRKAASEDAEEASELSAPSGKIVYKAILKEGEEELDRSTAALFWSGLAAGLSMGFSMIAE